MAGATGISHAGCVLGRNAPLRSSLRSPFPRLYRFARVRLGGDEDAAEEVAQTTLIKSLAKVSTYRGEAALFTWVCAICRREISVWFARTRNTFHQSLADDASEMRAVLDAIAALTGGGAENGDTSGAENSG